MFPPSHKVLNFLPPEEQFPSSSTRKNTNVVAVSSFAGFVRPLSHAFCFFLHHRR
ncbi:hypothetical protein I3842_01G036100 [Carya illinoinensis]|uniref:Uncharacterized protein n=1 Tax=Carya illinoinensis TaxID=32201 RepID=A0A922FZH6_CARIL|nr:hypothetical protein I3842_01G036100 [Carya illinoinensis]